MLSIKNLNKTYANGVHATNNVNLEIPNGLIRLAMVLMARANRP